MPALLKFLVLLAIFLAGNQARVNHLIRFQQPMSDPMNEPSREPIREPTNDRKKSEPIVSYSHNVTLNSGNKPPYTLVQCPRTQWIFFPEKGFPAVFDEKISRSKQGEQSKLTNFVNSNKDEWKNNWEEGRVCSCCIYTRYCYWVTDFTATNGTSVVFASGLPAGDIVDMVAYGAVGGGRLNSSFGTGITYVVVVKSHGIMSPS